MNAEAPATARARVLAVILISDLMILLDISIVITALPRLLRQVQTRLDIEEVRPSRREVAG
jgi:hypothetical protein